MNNYYKSTMMIIVTLIVCIIIIGIAFSNAPASKTGQGEGELILGAELANNHNLVSMGDFFKEVPSDVSGMKKYTLKVVLPTVKADVFFRIPATFSKFRIFIDDQKLISIRWSDIQDAEYPTVRLLSYHPEKPTFTITCYIDDNTYGINSAYANITRTCDFYIGYSKEIKLFQDIAEVFEFGLFLLCLFYCYSQLIEYFYRRNHFFNIVLAIYSLTIAIEILFHGQFLHRYFFDPISMTTGLKIIIVTYTIRNLLIMLLTMHIFRIHLLKNFYILLIVTLTSLQLVPLFVPNMLYYYLYYIYQIISIICLGFCLALALIYYRLRSVTRTSYYICGCIVLIMGNFLSAALVKGYTAYYGFTQLSFVMFIFFVNSWTRKIYSESMDNIKNISASMKEAIFKVQDDRSTYITAHLRPSTIYNSLDVIRENIDTDQDTVDNMIQALSKYLRHTLDFSSDKLLSGIPEMNPDELGEYLSTYTIEDELQLCNAYITLMEKKYPGVKFDINCDEAALDSKIPRSSIQTLIENSLLHAFGGTLHPEIKVDVTTSGDHVAVSVYDNGKGMTREEINKYLNIPSFTLIFGIYHLNQHLKDEFDTELWIDSRTNKYTRVYFQVPLVETKNRKEAAVR